VHQKRERLDLVVGGYGTAVIPTVVVALVFLDTDRQRENELQEPRRRCEEFAWGKDPVSILAGCLF